MSNTIAEKIELSLAKDFEKTVLLTINKIVEEVYAGAKAGKSRVKGKFIVGNDTSYTSRIDVIIDLNKEYINEFIGSFEGTTYKDVASAIKYVDLYADEYKPNFIAFKFYKRIIDNSIPIKTKTCKTLGLRLKTAFENLEAKIKLYNYEVWRGYDFGVTEVNVKYDVVIPSGFTSKAKDDIVVDLYNKSFIE